MQPEPPKSSTLLTGWGRTAPTAATVHRPRSVEEVRSVLAAAGGRGVIARGLGRSYGDAAQAAGGDVLDCTALAGNRSFDPDTGLVTASAGLSLEALMRDLLPLGWFVPVTPGTRHVTVGGAIAADIHGKNHHVDGSFGAHVRSLTLVTPDGSVRTLAPDGGDADGTALFWATVGGMGLTGVIVEATIQATAAETAFMRVDTERARNLDAALETMTATDDNYRYTVAWIDLLASGDALGRSVLTRGDHARRSDLPARKRPLARRFDPAVRLHAPPWAPSGLLNRSTVRAFNEMWFRKAPAARRDEIQPITAFFHPLDFVGGWNRLYGRAGMVQYQFVVPVGAEDTLRHIVTRLSGSGVASFLAVLKRFGPAGPGLLSFPVPGWTLALDIPAGVPGLARLLGELDVTVADAGGRVYLAKDAVLSRDLLPKMYPRLPEWHAVRARVDPEGTMCSDLARRLGL